MSAAIAPELYISGGPLDLSIEGPGFFALRRPDGSRALTRAGAFTVDRAGLVVTPYGDRLDPPVVLPFRTRPEDVTVELDGAVSVAGRTLGRICPVAVPAPEALALVGPRLYVPTRSSGMPLAVAARILQGTLEL